MTFRRLLLENLLYHWRGNLAVLLGVVVGTAVLTGALLVGDSLRGSLRDVAEEQLGWVDLALVNKRFFREELATELPAPQVSPAIFLQVSAAKEVAGDAGSPRVRQVVLLGVDQKFWEDADGTTDVTLPQGLPANFWQTPPAALASADKQGVVLGAALARDLGIGVGDQVTFSLQRISAAPRETILGRRETRDVVADWSLSVKAVLPANHFGSRFTLNPGPSLPRNAFVPLYLLQNELRRQDRKTRSLPERPINAILVGGRFRREALDHQLNNNIQLEDWGLALRTPKRKFAIPAPKYVSLESREMFVPPAAHQAVEKAKLRQAATLVYLVNNMASRQHLVSAAALLVTPPGGPEFLRGALRSYAPVEVPYAIVAALDPALKPPLGPFLPPGTSKLGDKEILLAKWEGSPLAGLCPKDVVVLSYFDPDDEGQLTEKTAAFRLAAHVPIAGARNDLHLTPVFPGITDSQSLAQVDGWDPPFPFHRWLVSDVDEDYWRFHRTTPKAYITLKAGQKLWGSRFGDVTSIRIDPEGKSPEEISNEILKHLTPAQGGFVFQAVRNSKVEAASSGTDFSLYFLGFSSFLIAAALLLVGLLFRLNMDRRATEIGLLLAVGHQRRTVRWLLLAEGGLLALVGGLLGLLAALGYAELLLRYLSVNWPGGLDRAFLWLHVTPFSLVVGFGAAVVVSALTILWATRVLSTAAPRDLLAGVMAGGEGFIGQRRWLWSKVLIGLLIGMSIVGAAVCFVVGTLVQDHEIKATSFLTSGMLLLTAGLSAVWLWLRRPHQQGVGRGGPVGLALLGIRNASRHPVRSLLTMGLLASATFLVVAVQAFHRDPGKQFLEKTGGSGGFPLLAESDVPVFEDLNGSKGRAALAQAAPEQQLPDDVTFYPFRVKEGDDVSCLNLYQPREPRVFSVPDSIIQRGGFQFAATEAETPAERANPWLLLQKPLPDGAIPVFGENDTVTYILGKGLGGELNITDESGQTVRLRIVGLLQDSVFQSELLMSEANFRKVYPRHEGYQFFLIDAPPDQTTQVRTVLEKALAVYGLAVTPTTQRLEAYLAVVNTYLATFQALGGLGLLLGALGLVVVLLRSVWERRGELALLRALGFRRSALGWLVLAENVYLLLLGLLVGTIAALLSVAPHVTGGTEVPWLQLAGLLVLVVSAGLLAGLLAVRATLRAPLLVALRRE